MRAVYLAMAIAAAAAAFWGGRAALVPQEPAVVPLPPLAIEGRRDLTLLEGEGRLIRGTPATGFRETRRGDVLLAGETLRVAPGARATLRIGLASKLSLEAGSELTALKAPAGELSLRLDDGRARVELSHPGRVLRVAATDGAELIATGGPSTRFLVAAHDGVLAVANPADGAVVRLRAGGSEVEVPPARASWSASGEVPTAPLPPPRDPGLELLGAVRDRADGAVVVSGRAHPLAIVRINGAAIGTDDDGAFETRLPDDAASPTQVLATLPTGPETLLEVTLPPLVTADEGERPEERRKKRGKRKKRRGKRGR